MLKKWLGQAAERASGVGVLGLAVLMIAGCAPGPTGPSTQTNPNERPAGTKTLTIGVLAPIKVYGHMEYLAGDESSLTEIHSEGLVTNGPTGGMEGRLASAVPSFDDGSMRLLSDGR